MGNYLGFKEVHLSGEELNIIFQEPQVNMFECYENEYVIAYDENDNLVGLFKYDGEYMKSVSFHTIESKFMGTVKPRNPEQRLALDLLYDHKTTVKAVMGKFGAGKDFLMCAAAADMIERNKFDKIVYIRNNIEAKNSRPIGYLPGTGTEKLLPFAMPLADHLGGTDELMMMVENNTIEIAHLGFIRGRDFRKSIIICDESENMTKDQVKLLISRIGEGSELWINGDFEQCDAEVFQNDSGLMAAVESLKGQKLFGCVTLRKTERSETAALADLIS